jgi:hypothetical protein
MAEGGQFPWKRQTIDSSRGPAAEYSSLRKPLPAPPKGVEWNYNSETKEWRLVRTDDADKSKYSLRMSSTWNPHTAREQSSIVPVPKHPSNSENAITMEHSNATKDAPVENKDYVVHTVLPTDTLAGLCLRYKTKPTLLRQVNKFSGSNLLLAPSKLIIPLDGKDISTVKIQDTSCPEYKLHALVAEYPHLRRTEAKAYLEMNDWNLEESIQSVREDEAWEEEEEKQLEQKRKNIKPVLNVHVAVPAEEVMDATTHDVNKTKAEEEKGLMEPLLRELELSPSGVMC